jgi:hypothetical protein
MKKVFHITTKGNDVLAHEIISKERAQPGTQIEVVDLTSGEPDYKSVLEKIFTADSVHVW